jgi:hypothetical protein
MSADWAKKLTRWPPHHDGSNSHLLTHVHPFMFTTVMPPSGSRPALSVDIRVGFSHHTFTRKALPEDAGVQPYLGRPSEPRIFCSERYALSQGLGAILRSLPERSCYFAKRENFFVIEGLQPNQEYRIFFDVRNVGASNAVLLYVQSAYPADKDVAPGSKRQKVRFRVLLTCALENRRVKAPP